MQSFRKILHSAGYRLQKRVTRQTCQANTRLYSTIELPPDLEKESQYFIPKGVLGQPTCHTHPHLIAPDHLTCGITQQEYRDRRDTLVTKLLSEVGNVYKNHVIVIPAASKQYMSDKIPFVFRQNSDFFYLTGCLEPSAVLVILKSALSDNYKSILFIHEKDSHAELWEGPRTGCVNAVRLFAVDEAKPIDSLRNFLQRTTGSHKPTAFWYHTNNPANPELHEAIRSALGHGSITLNDPQKALHLMRIHKSPAEIELMKETCYIGSQSMNMAMACTRPGVSESLINAVLDYSCRQAGAEQLAFPPVVAGGSRATHIHYVTNKQLLDKDEMILVDSGSQYWLYNSDISRTWPVGGKFNPHHRILYELVLTVQKRLIEIAGERRPPLDQLFDSMCRLLGLHLQEEGILPKNIDGNELISQAYRLCPHHVSHYLGIDVHDTPLVKRNIPLENNMIFTVEPGIYIRPDDTSVPHEFRGLGIRIEDDVLLTDDGPVVLTDAAVKEVQDIEAIVGKHSS